ncbi:CRP-like cAMP-binding protein/di/tricarboxylate transporter [Paenibacillus phyllosphaerae]|uniref:CRP-like cAMP-binding protein/di/tricarboxylate transporter n=1 Tax=Paenibacillus phyllosphaerae TaxID=274593 RepID=A0A7W5AXX0_9BACL|nr:SLC13 family permease [Paenibacillus phyllosphaerae]MBB3110794.1 CRP-like cAMP-binding protein/di/tricarboxylate transporter [Paenibacillus phyllosphaerae]
MKLSDIALFQGLTNMELSKLLGKLAKRTLQAGQTLFEQGDYGESMFIIERGTAQLYSQQGGARQPLAVLGEGDSFGEMALFTGEARSATVVAVTEITLYEIDRDTFDQLIAEHQVISAYFIKLLSSRLTATNDRLHATLATKSEWVNKELEGLPEPAARVVYWCAALPYGTEELLQSQFGGGMLPELRRYPELSKLLGEEQGPRGIRLRVKAEFRSVLKEQAASVQGGGQLERWRIEAANYYTLHGHWLDLAELHAEDARWPDVLQAVKLASAEAHEGDQEEHALLRLLHRCPSVQLTGDHEALELYIALCMRHDAAELGLQALEAAIHEEADEDKPKRLAAWYEWAAELSGKLERHQQALEYWQLAEAAAGSTSAAQSEERVYELARQERAGRKSRARAERAARLLGGQWTSLLSLLGAVFCIVLSALVPEVGGLSREGMIFIGIGLAAVILWIVGIIPDYIVALGMVMLWVLIGLVEPKEALSGFASPTWLYMIFIMGLSAAITRSGILYRFSLYALKKFPPHYRGQLWGIIAGGIVLNPLIPSSSAKVSLGVPIARTLSESMGFKDRSGGAAGLGLSAMIFYGFTAPFMLTGSYTNAMAYGLVPNAPSVSWLAWALYALPGFAIFSAVMIAWLSFMFRGTKAARPIEAGVLDEQIRLLGPLTKGEKVSMLTVTGCIALMMLQPLHGVDSTWILMAGFALLVMSGVLDRHAILNGIDWPFLLFLGVAFSFANAADALGITEALSNFLGEHMQLFIASPALFLIAVALLSFLVTIVVRDDPAVILLVTALIPLAQQAGVDPWIVVFIILLSTDPFFFSYQSPTYLTAYYSSEEKAFSHRQGQKVAIGYGLAVLLVAVLCVPYWRMLGLIH